MSPITQSAKKALRQNVRRQEQNLKKKRAIKDWEKKVLRALKAGKMDEAKKTFPQLQKALDKAAKTNVIHKNAAARTKSRISKKLRGK